MLSILILVLKELGEPLKPMRNVSFQPVPEDLVREIILSLDGSKATPAGDIPADILKSTVNIRLPFITKIINVSFENGRFPDGLKLDTFMRGKLSKLLTGFRKNYSAQHYLTSVLEMWKNTLDKGGYVSAIFLTFQRPLTH